MATFNNTTRDIRAKIVYYGAGQSGKTTNIQYIHAKLKPDLRGELMTLATEQDRTLFFDYLPVDLGEVSGFKTRIQLYTVPGQVFYNSTRKLVLKNADGIVFVADSARKFMKDNLESFQNLMDNLRDYGLKITDLPVVIQYNKRDIPDAVPVGELQEKLNRFNFPSFEAVASSGTGVLPTFQALSKLVMKHIKETALGGIGLPTPPALPSLASKPVPPRPEPAKPPEPPKPALRSMELDDDEEALLDSLGPPASQAPAMPPVMAALPVQPARSAAPKPGDAVPTTAILAAAGIAPPPGAITKNTAQETISKGDPIMVRLEVVSIGSALPAPGGGFRIAVRLKDPSTGRLYETRLDLTLKGESGGT